MFGFDVCILPDMFFPIWVSTCTTSFFLCQLHPPYLSFYVIICLPLTLFSLSHTSFGVIHNMFRVQSDQSVPLLCVLNTTRQLDGQRRTITA